MWADSGTLHSWCWEECVGVGGGREWATLGEGRGEAPCFGGLAARSGRSLTLNFNGNTFECVICSSLGSFATLTGGGSSLTFRKVSPHFDDFFAPAPSRLWGLGLYPGARICALWSREHLAWELSDEWPGVGLHSPGADFPYFLWCFSRSFC